MAAALSLTVIYIPQYFRVVRNTTVSAREATYIEAARARGLGVVYITHNLHHVFEVADRLTVLSHGHKLGDFSRSDVTADEVARMIVGE